jgi:hypothetical protein
VPLRNVIRPHLFDRTWDAADLDAAAEFWLRLYETAARKNDYGPPSHAVEFRLRGFPRHEVDQVCDALEQRLGDAAASRDAEYSPFDIDQPDADTLTASFGPIPGDGTLPAGWALERLDGPPLDGLFLEVRIRAGSATKQVRATLVLIGELRGGRLALRALWRTGSTGVEDDLSWATPWDAEQDFLAALAEFRQSRETRAEFAEQVFLPRFAEQLGGLAIAMIHVPLDKPRLGGLLLRGLALLAIVVGLGYAVGRVLAELDWLGLPSTIDLVIAAIKLLPGGLLLLCFVWLSWQFVKNEWNMFVTGHWELHRRYSRLYAQPVKLRAISCSTADALLANPWTRKYQAELEKARFAHLGDLQANPSLDGEHVIRVFVAPDGITSLAILYQLTTDSNPQQALESWPAMVAFVGGTFFTDGARITSVNGRTTGYRKKRTAPDHLSRVFVDAEHPLEFIERHLAAAEKFAARTGRTPVRQESLEDYIRRQNDLQEEERQLYQDEPFTWGDAVWWYFQLPRRVYLRS